MGRVILDGGSPGSALTSTTSLPSLSGRSCGSTTTLTALSQDLMPVEKVDNIVDSANNENLNPNRIVDLKVVDEKSDEEEEERGAIPRRGVKRRSLTETGEIVRPLQVAQQQ